MSRALAMIGTSAHCIAQNPGDMAVALRLLDATVETVKPDGTRRTIGIADFHKLPGETPEIEVPLVRSEFITPVILPPR